MPRSELTAVLSTLAGAALWGLVWLPLTRLEEAGLHGLWITFLVFTLIGGAALPLVVTACRRGSCPFRWGPVLLLIVFGGCTNLFFFLALTKTTVVRALMLFYLSPVWNLFIGRLIKGHPLTAKKFLVVFLSLAGAAVLLGLHHGTAPQWNSGDSFALLSGLAFALSVIGLQLSPATPSWALTVLHWLGAAVTAGIGIVVLKPPPPTLATIDAWLPLLLFFAFGMQATASLCILFSLTRLESYRVNILMLFEIIVGTVSSALLAAQGIAPHEWAGIMLIIFASLLDNLRRPPQPLTASPPERG